MPPGNHYNCKVMLFKSKQLCQQRTLPSRLPPPATLLWKIPLPSLSLLASVLASVAAWLSSTPCLCSHTHSGPVTHPWLLLLHTCMCLGRCGFPPSSPLSHSAFNTGQVNRGAEFLLIKNVLFLCV